MQPVRGTQDLLGNECAAFRFIDNTTYEVAKLFGFEEIRTPIFEFSEVFHRTLGETSDVINKETYTFKDRGGDEITLRPEGTAGIARAFISNGLAQNLPLKYYYSGPMFRYERPQKGRYRQFHQVGIEMLGIDTPIGDIECISLAWMLLQKLNLSQSAQLEINTLGDQESRTNYRAKLIEYLQDYKTQLSEDSKNRLEKNPMRILDSKDEGDKKIILSAPKYSESLNQASKDFFGAVLDGVRTLKIPFVLNEKLVRGLDYYSHTVFEFTTTQLGAQGTILAGGRYDGLIEMMGGQKTAGVGWAAGIERLSLLLDQSLLSKNSNTVAMIPAADVAYSRTLELTQELRQQGFTCEFLHSGNMGKKFKRANKIGAKWALVLGDTELANNQISVKNLSTGDQSTIPISQLFDFIKS